MGLQFGQISVLKGCSQHCQASCWHQDGPEDPGGLMSHEPVYPFPLCKKLVSADLWPPFLTSVWSSRFINELWKFPQALKLRTKKQCSLYKVREIETHCPKVGTKNAALGEGRWPDWTLTDLTEHHIRILAGVLDIMLQKGCWKNLRGWQRRHTGWKVESFK